MPRLRLTAFGTGRLLLLNGQTDPEVKLESGKPLALLVYVNSKPNLAATRDTLIDLLWSDMGRDQAKHSLRQALWYIRRRVGADLFGESSDPIQLRNQLSSDVADFEEAVAQRRHEDAVRLCGEDFLALFAGPGCREFEDWAENERIRLRSLFVRAAHELTQERLRVGRFKDAQRLATRVRDADPFNESGWRLLLEVYIAAGQPIAASTCAQQLESAFAAEGMDIEPSTRELVQLARNVPGASARPVAPETLSSYLVGREAEFTALLNAWDEARAGRLRVVRITAAPGLGKSRLMEDFRARLRSLRARTSFVRATQWQRDVPYALAGDLISSLARLPGARGIAPPSGAALVALNPAVPVNISTPADTATGTEALRRRALAVKDLLNAVSDENPLALFVDDFHWADPTSKALLSMALGGLDASRILVVIAARPTTGVALSELESTQLPLHALTPASVHQLIANLGTLPGDEWATRFPVEMVEATGGSPLLILETLQLLIDHGRLRLRDGEWSLVDAVGLVTDLRVGSAISRRVSGLDRAAAWILLHLSLARAPLSPSRLSQAAGCSTEEASDILSVIEGRGFVRRADDRWLPAHDTIADAVLEAFPADAQRAAARGLASMLMQSADAEEGDLVAAVRHASTAGDAQLSRQAFSRLVRRQRRRGERRPNEDLATEALGDEGDRTSIQDLVHGLPLPYRIGLYSVRRIAAMIAILAGLPLVGLAVLLLVRLQPVPPDAEFVVFSQNARRGIDGYVYSVRRSEWESANAIRSWWRQSPRVRVASNIPLANNGLLPTGEWIGYGAVRDSGAIDLFAVAADGTARRLTATTGDDGTPTLSPDRRWAAFGTARWSELSRSDIAILDLSTQQVRQVTRGPESDGAPVWRPNGTAIVFQRKFWDGRAHTICTVSVDGADERCVDPGRATLRRPLAWYGERSVIAMRTDSMSTDVVLVDLQSGSIRALATAVEPSMTEASPDGAWISCQCSHLGYPRGAHFVFPLSHLDDFRLVAEDSLHRVNAVRWIDRRPPNYIASVHIETNGRASTGVSHRLRLTAMDLTGATAEPTDVRWTSMDTTVATIDARTGVLLGTREGTVTIVASAGGWRADTAAVEIAQRRNPTEVLAETWHNGLRDWLPFGVPRPITVSDATLGSAFLNNGDGSFASGAVSRVRVPTTDGVAMDAVIASHLTLPQWQLTELSLAADPNGADTTAWRRIEYDRASPEASCLFRYPRTEGPESDSLDAGTLGGGRLELSASPPPRGTSAGRPMHVRIQLFPDGRCGVAVDGTPVALTQVSLPNVGWVRAIVSGSSRATRMLVGTLRVVRGVPDDIDWLSFEQRRQSRQARSLTVSGSSGRRRAPSVDAR